MWTYQHSYSQQVQRLARPHLYVYLDAVGVVYARVLDLPEGNLSDDAVNGGQLRSAFRLHRAVACRLSGVNGATIGGSGVADSTQLVLTPLASGLLVYEPVVQR